MIGMATSQRLDSRLLPAACLQSLLFLGHELQAPFRDKKREVQRSFSKEMAELAVVELLVEQTEALGALVTPDAPP